jgi:pyroglutamyl-peptidase
VFFGMTNQRKNWILITGFGSFPGVDQNPTQKLVHNLSTIQFQNTDVIAKVLDVSFERSTLQITQILSKNKYPPIFLLHFGVSRDPFIRIENQATNTKHATIPDVDGSYFRDTPIDRKYPLDQSLSTNINTLGLMKHLKQEGYPARISNDAGRYVCNSTYYHSLRWIENNFSTMAPSIPTCLFVHVPPQYCVFYENNQELTWTPPILFEVGKKILHWMLQKQLK